jgi:hypothetical protein
MESESLCAKYIWNAYETIDNFAKILRNYCGSKQYL